MALPKKVKKTTPRRVVKSAPKAVKKTIPAIIRRPDALIRESVPVAMPMSAPISAPEPIAPVMPVDTQQEFFKSIGEKIAAERTSKSEEPHDINASLKAKSVNLYRKIAIRFIILALVLVAIVGYFSLTKLTITISPNKEVIPGTLTVDVYGNGNFTNQDRAIKGNIARLEETVSGTFAATGEKTGPEQFSGRVKIYNNYTKAQPLVASTRLLTADGKLFRLKSSVTVPVGGSVEVDVYPDKPGADMAIAPTRFTIPGLWEGIQDKIYAESSVAFSSSANTQKIITDSDVEMAKQELSNRLVDKVKQSLGGVNSQYDQVFFDSNPLTAQAELVGSKIGDEKAQFEVKIKNIVNVISFNNEEIDVLAKDQLTSSLTSDKTLVGITPDSLAYSLANYSAESNVATVNVSFSGQVAASQTDFIDKAKLANLNQSQIESYLSGVKEVNSFKLKFFPGFIKRAPSLIDRIQIIIE
jgi:hypothetical protein